MSRQYLPQCRCGSRSEANGGGTLVINNEGSIVGSNTLFTANTNIYAKWTANDYTITLNNIEADVAGTTTLYEKYNTAWYTDLEAEPVTTITIPEKEGFTFGGYCTEIEGAGTLIVNSEGNIVGSNTAFKSNTSIYANWISE